MQLILFSFEEEFITKLSARDWSRGMEEVKKEGRCSLCFWP